MQATVCNEEELSGMMEEKQAIAEQTCLPPTSSASLSQRNVLFQHVEIQKYDVTLGKHLNEYNLGPSITLNWSYHYENKEDAKITVDKYNKAQMPSCTEDLFALSRLEREEILQNQGFHKSVFYKVTQSTPIQKQWNNKLESWIQNLHASQGKGDNPNKNEHSLWYCYFINSQSLKYGDSTNQSMGKARKEITV